MKPTIVKPWSWICWSHKWYWNLDWGTEGQESGQKIPRKDFFWSILSPWWCKLTYFILFYLPYARHHNPLLIRNRSWILTIHKGRILRKKPLEKRFLDFKKWVKSIQTAGYNGACTVSVKTFGPCIPHRFIQSLTALILKDAYMSPIYLSC